MPIKLIQLDDNLLIKILDQLPIKDKFKCKLVSHRFNRLINLIIKRIDTLNLKQINLCSYTSSKFNEFNTLNLSNINQINKILNKFIKIDKLKLKLNCDHQLDYRQLNSPSTVYLKEFYLLANSDSIYKQVIYLQSILNVRSLTIYSNKFDHLKITICLVSFLNYFQRLELFRSNLKHSIELGCSNQTNNQLNDHVTNHYHRPSNQIVNKTFQLRNHLITNLHLPHFIIDSSSHLNLIKSFTRLKRITILSVKEEHLERFVDLASDQTHLIIKHLNTQFINLDYLFSNLIKLKNLRYLNLTIHQLKFDLKLRLTLTDYLIKQPKTRLIINNFEINDLNLFQRFLNILPNRIKQTFNLKHLGSDELDFNYCSNEALNRFVYSQLRSFIIKQYMRPNQLKNIASLITNLHYLEIRDYFGNTDELICVLVNSRLNDLKVLKLLKVNINDVNTYTHLTKFSNLIHLEIEPRHNANSGFDNRICNSRKYRHLQSAKLIDDLFDNDDPIIEKQLINNLYSFVKFDKLQKLILRNLKLTTSLLLYLLQNCSNLYLINVEHCANVDHFLVRNALKNKFALSPILNR